MKRLLFIFLCCILSFVNSRSIGQVYVSPGGSDKAEGTIGHPFATLGRAIRQTRELRRLRDTTVRNGVHIIMRGGLYQLEEPVFIRPEDAGTPQSPAVIEAAGQERPVLSGGVAIHGWHRVMSSVPGLPVVARKKVWVADVPEIGGQLFNFRQLWVNGSRAIRARDRDADSMSRILSWNKKEETCWIPTPKTSNLALAQGLEMYIHQWWAIAILRVKSFEQHGDSTQLAFYQPESHIESEHPWPAPRISKELGNSAFYLTNAIQLLNSPGEWFLDVAGRKLYYWPRQDEDMNTANVVAPYLETLLSIKGTIDHPVNDIQFKGISFQFTGWLRPSQQGHVPLQAGMYLLDAYKLAVPGTADKKGLENQGWVGRPAAAIEVSFAQNTDFENCRFEHLGSTALDYTRGTFAGRICGNLFSDIGGSGINIGVFSDEATEAHLPYNPMDLRDVCSNTLINNNLVTDVANDDWGCVGINAGYVRNTEISHNEISDVSYMGICLGWGWTKTLNVMKDNLIFANKIHHYAKNMYDVAGIYTLSAQPGTIISNNYIDSIYKAPYAHIPKHWFYLYTDEGSSYMTVKNNWCPSEKFLQNANGPCNVWENNGPAVPDSIKQEAGLQAGYFYLLPDKKVNRNWPVNHEIK
jgi:hypothetical protein